jgi:hypothetical protein
VRALEGADEEGRSLGRRELGAGMRVWSILLGEGGARGAVLSSVHKAVVWHRHAPALRVAFQSGAGDLSEREL